MLIKVVLQALMVFSMSVFLLPKKLCHEIDCLFSNFCWGIKDNGSKLHGMSWQKLGEHRANGGLGFHDLHSFNKALLAKQLWRLVTCPASLVATVLWEKYCKIENIILVKVKSHNLLLWKTLLTTREIIEGALRWRVGNGEKIKIKGDRWLPTRATFQV